MVNYNTHLTRRRKFTGATSTEQTFRPLQTLKVATWPVPPRARVETPKLNLGDEPVNTRSTLFRTALASIVLLTITAAPSFGAVNTEVPTERSEAAVSRAAFACQFPSQALYTDNSRGPQTICAIQVMLKHYGYYTGWIDGDFGTITKKSFQRFLKARGYYSGTIDGVWGAQSSGAEYYWGMGHPANAYVTYDSWWTTYTTQRVLNWERINFM